MDWSGLVEAIEDGEIIKTKTTEANGSSKVGKKGRDSDEDSDEFFEAVDVGDKDSTLALNKRTMSRKACAFILNRIEESVQMDYLGYKSAYNRVLPFD